MRIQDHRGRLIGLAAVISAASVALVAVACGGSSAKSAQVSPTAVTDTSGGGRGGRFRGTVPPDVQTSIAEGTRPAFRGNFTPPPAAQTAIAQGTPFAALGGMRTRSPEVQTAIAQGTPASAFRFGAGFGGARLLQAAATVLGIDQQQLRAELQAPGASLESVAAAHGLERATLRQRLLDAAHAAIQQALAAGTITEQEAADAASGVDANIDSLIDRVGDSGLLDAPPAMATPVP